MKVRKALLTIATIGLLSTLAGCFPQPLPDEQRYGNIDAVLEHLDPETAGEVIRKTKDAGDGITSTSFRLRQVKGPDTAQIINDRLTTLPNLKCSQQGVGHANCNNGIVLIRIYAPSEEENTVVIKIQDSSNGHKTPTPNGQ